jgi:hypothetical protein
MKTLGLATAVASLADDHDMSLLLAACQKIGFVVEVCAWDDPTIDWSRYDHVVLRSTWDYPKRLPQFLGWCERVSAVTDLINPLPVVRWSLDKHYLADLSSYGVPVVASRFIDPSMTPLPVLREFLAMHPPIDEMVVKPTIGAYSKDVKRFSRAQESEIVMHIARLLGENCSVILQPYLASIDSDGETNLIYFDQVYSHAIRKSALLMQDGTVNAPTYDFRTARVADEDERAVARAAIDAASAHLSLGKPLPYARVDLIRCDDGKPQVLELEIFEPSLSLPLADGSAERFAQVLADLPIPDKLTSHL